MQSTRTNLIHSLKTHCFDCVKQLCRLRVIFYLREFCSLDTDSIEFFMSRSNRCHKNVWIYYYYSWMSFDSNTTDYKTTYEQLEARKADDIIIQMKELLNFDHQQLKKMKLIIKVQINKHRWNVIYEVDDWVWLSFRNVKTTRLCKDLKDKQLNLYQITVKVNIFYHLHLSVSMKHLHLMFSSKLLQSYSENSLSEQHLESLRLITIKNDEH